MLRGGRNIFQHRAHQRTVAPTAEPVTVSEVKEHLRLSLPDEDKYISSLISQIREEFEELTGLALLGQTWELTLDYWPGPSEPWWDGVRVASITAIHGDRSLDFVELPRHPLTAVTAVSVSDEGGNETAVDVANTFNIDTASKPGRMILKDGKTWPIATRNRTGIEITYTAGYTSVPAPLKRALLNMIAYAYEHRGDCSAADAYAKSGARSVARSYARVRI